ncbi:MULTISPECIES: alpha-1,2-fucosyltransferase [Sphingobacterium]|uniref:alpha-1,2-fucosyltransferase n=1 Tax=Sphingobacterium TaxID=28453 RepID=UPI0013E46B6F|nr:MULTISPECIES: alpha-1,2-fucosyltransferase [Sphingobacterium]QIH36266.1 alpha-1,2-fucosyltransferase [Sphingobacterium sp. DR205]
MKIVKFLGGLGNQLFQYAFLLALHQKFKTVKADLSDFKSYQLHNGFELNTIFNINLPQINSFEHKLYLRNNNKWIWRKLRQIYNTTNAYIEESPEFAYSQKIFEDHENRYYWGYWQHIHYLNRVEDLLRQTLQFPPFENSENIRIQNLIHKENAVSLHVRRGDYLLEPLFKDICTEDYYRKSIEYIEETQDSPVFVIFSNDILWCKSQFKDINAIFVDHNIGLNSFRDLQLMSLCKHHIIANSSFSWWGAWLNGNPDKVVVSPKKWINNTSIDTSGLILSEFITF